MNNLNFYSFCCLLFLLEMTISSSINNIYPLFDKKKKCGDKCEVSIKWIIRVVSGNPPKLVHIDKKRDKRIRQPLLYQYFLLLSLSLCAYPISVHIMKLKVNPS